MYEFAMASLGTWRTRSIEPGTDVSANVLTDCMAAKLV